MSSRKSERLINLTIALLATKRFLTKSEILRTVEGYEGSSEAKDRMFERDKDDLRSLGISIEVASVDPLFEDEPGYRIRHENYSLNLKDLNGQDIALLSLAAKAWQEASLGSAAQSALIKLNSLGINSDYQSIPSLSPKIFVDSPHFLPLLDAISERNSISFQYLTQSAQYEVRKVNPMGIGNRFGHWYLVGFDIERDSLRTFRLDRIGTELTVGKKSFVFEIPADFSASGYLDISLERPTDMAVILIRKGKGNDLRVRAESITEGDDFDTCVIPYPYLQTFLNLLLWHGDDVIVESPAHLKESIIATLRKLVLIHE